VRVAVETELRHRLQEVLAHLGRGRVALRGIASECAHADVLEDLRVALDLARRARDRVLGDRAHHLQLVGALEQAALRRQLVEHDAEREDVAASIERLAAALLGAHVGVLAFDLAARRLGEAMGSGRDAEVEQLDVTAVGHEHVLRRHVAVDELEVVACLVGELVGGVKPVADLRDDPRAEPIGDGLVPLGQTPHDAGEVLADQVLHDEEQVATDLAELVDLDEVRVLGA
jgi:hypothetical protein